MLRSRDQPDTVDQHQTALAHAEQLVRRNPPDLAHRAAELSRDLLYLENSFDLEVGGRGNPRTGGSGFGSVFLFCGEAKPFFFSRFLL